MLTGVPVDKPPLLIYLTALSFFVFGQSELAARLPNLIASVISVPLLYQLTRRYGPQQGSAAFTTEVEASAGIRLKAQLQKS